MNDGVTRVLATLSSVKRTRQADEERAEWFVSADRVAEAVAKIEADVGELKAELSLLDERRSWKSSVKERKAA